MEHFGGKLDFVFHSIGMSECSKREALYCVEPRLDDQGWDVSAVPFHNQCNPFRQDAMNEWEVL